MALNFSAKNVTIWKVEITTTKGGKEYARLQCSTQKKNRQTGNYETDWSGVVDLWNGAYDKFKENGLKEKDRINILNGQHTNTYSRESKRTFENYNIWAGEDYEIANQNTNSVNETKTENSAPTTMQPIDNDDFLPF